MSFMSVEDAVSKTKNSPENLFQLCSVHAESASFGCRSLGTFLNLMGRARKCEYWELSNKSKNQTRFTYTTITSLIEFNGKNQLRHMCVSCCKVPVVRLDSHGPE